MKKLLSTGCVLFLAVGLCLPAPFVARAAEETINEDELFSGSETIEEPTKISDEADQELNKAHFGISGELSSKSSYTQYQDTALWKTDEISNTISTDVMLDWRFKGGVKSFVNIGAYLYPEGQTESTGDKTYHDALLKEYFVDANWRNRIYFRGGKQVLKWGRSYFWNPTDLINVEKKDFYDLDKNREGTNGLKVHIPSGVKQNIYCFANLEDGVDDLALAGKYEWLVKNSEMSLSAWWKDGVSPVFGYDLSTHIGKLDWRAEVSLADGADYKRLKIDDSATGTPDTVDGWYPQASIGFTRYFNNGNYKDRISLNGEFYYNGAGYSENIYQEMANKSNYGSILANYVQNYYQSFCKSKYYFALFGTVSKFLIPEMTLNVNTMSNLVDYSTVLTTGVSYKPTIKNWSLDFNLYTYLGADESEAKFMGQSYSLDLGLTLQF